MADVTIGASNSVSMPAGCDFSYNGVIFGPLCRTKVTEEPITSGDGRTVKYSKITINVSGWITQADAGTNYRVAGAGSAAIVNGGTGYSVNDVLTIQGGTNTVAVQITVNTVDGGGAITGGTVTNLGAYTVKPANPVSVLGGTGNNDATFNLTWTVASVNTLDALLLSIRRRLQVHGKNLVYVNKGYGIDISVGPNGAQRDVAFGARSGKFTFFSLGGAPDGCHGAAFEWEISTCIAECSSFAIAPGVFVEVAFTASYDTDEAGLVTITYHGNAQIPMSLRADNTLDRNIDSELGRIIRDVPIGFIRRMSRQISADRANCSFTITDRQVEVVFPNDVVSIDMKQRVRQSRPFSPIWDCSISGSVRLAPEANKALAWRRFFSIAAQRISFIRNHVPVASMQGASGVAGAVGGFLASSFWKPNVFVMTSEMEEDLFKNESRFTINFRILGAPFDVIAQVSGLWQPIVNNATNLPPGGAEIDAGDWNTSLALGPQKYKGISGAGFDNASEVIIDVCAGPVPPSPGIAAVGGVFGEVAGGEGEVEDDDTDDIEPQALIQGVATTIEDRFPPQTSWLSWQCKTERFVDHRRIRHKPLSGTVTVSPVTVNPLGTVANVAADTTLPSGGYDATVPDVIQQTGAPSLLLRLTGFGVRLAYRVNPPRLLSYGGRTAYLLREHIAEEEMGASTDAVMYRTDWVLEYLIPGSTTTCPLPANPMLGTSGESAASGDLLSGIIG